MFGDNLFHAHLCLLAIHKITFLLMQVVLAFHIHKKLSNAPSRIRKAVQM